MKKLTILTIILCLLVLSLSSPQAFGKEDISSTVLGHMKKLGYNTIGIKVTPSHILSFTSDKSEIINATTITATINISLNDVLLGMESFDDYVMFIAFDSGLSLSESQHIRSTADIIRWLTARGIDITKGDTAEISFDVAMKDGKLYVVYDDGTLEDFDKAMALHPDPNLAKQNRQKLEMYFPSISQTGFNRYNKVAAINYMLAYTSTNGNTICSPKYKTPSYYNFSHYTCFNGNDCANFVSQALRHGNIPTDTQWYPYTSSWKTAPGLRNHFMNFLHIPAPTQATSCFSTNITHIINEKFTM